MRVTEQGQVTIPKLLRDRFGLDCGAEVEITATEDGILIRKCDEAENRNAKSEFEAVYESIDCDDPIERVALALRQLGFPHYPIDDVDAYIEEIRGR